MKTLMILTAALAIAFVSGFFTAPTAYAHDACSEVSFCTVFTTSTFHQGNLNGLAGADAICNARAAEASLPGIYMAWLADQTGSPSTRFVQSTVPYVLTDGATVANSYNALVTDGTLLHAIDRDESGVMVSGGGLGGFGNWTNVTPRRDTDTAIRHRNPQTWPVLPQSLAHAETNEPLLSKLHSVAE